MSNDFILYYSATEIEAEDNPKRADEWLIVAATYVTTFEYHKMDRCYERGYKGFKDGWKILYEANLISKSMDEYLREAKPLGEWIEAIPSAT